MLPVDMLDGRAVAPRLVSGGGLNPNLGEVGGGVPVPVLEGVPLVVIDKRTSRERWRYFNRKNLSRVVAFEGGSKGGVGGDLLAAIGAALDPKVIYPRVSKEL